MGVNVRIYRALLLAELQAASQYRVQSVLWLLFAIVRLTNAKYAGEHAEAPAAAVSQ